MIATLQPLDSAHDNLRSWNRVSGRSNPGDTRQPGRYAHV